ncbi:hypothetical protein OE88DRAFT_1669032 [Heliocybe sulcata]|uniref:DUF7330 domain-containing protein n=1 Tax=Heliocybe sulcata TaxID=5364 RepID=A0A5C3MMR5_9AGAM|nr:hypothetical protein OE88DRAFT_1669032 [Heliocybe sulcata]
MPFKLTSNSDMGSVEVHLPQSYAGLLIASTDMGKITFSPQLAPHVTVISDVGGKQHCYVGAGTEWPEEDLDPETWEGSEVRLSSAVGSIKVKYVDEGTRKWWHKKAKVDSQMQILPCD